MKRILSVLAVLLFVAGCGGGSDTATTDDAGSSVAEDVSDMNGDIGGESLTRILGIDNLSEDLCSSPLLVPPATLPEGSHPEFLIDLVNAEQPEEDGTVLRLESDGTMSGNMGSSSDIGPLTEIHEECEIGTEPPDFAGDWVLTQDHCFCMKVDILPGVAACIYLLDDKDPETACSGHEKIPAETEHR